MKQLRQYSTLQTTNAKKPVKQKKTMSGNYEVQLPTTYPVRGARLMIRL